VAGVDPLHIVYVDETGMNTSMTRTYGRAPEGERAHGAVMRSWTTLTPHQAPSVRKAVERTGAKSIALPPSSPDYSPIEEMFSKVKGS
jgi:hypothetical protein